MPKNLKVQIDTTRGNTKREDRGGEKTKKKKGSR